MQELKPRETRLTTAIQMAWLATGSVLSTSLSPVFALSIFTPIGEGN